MSHTLFLVSHTHWDREWHHTFQQLRIRLVRLMDKLLDILAHDPEYRYFTLDGQTIVLEDYLEIRPEREVDIRRLVREGRLLIGPWYVLPDEFLVSPEALIRNLMRGDQVARRFGSRMMIGYVPDPFGHIGQLPQILQGFSIGVAAFRRGLDDHPTELWWEAPDGSRVLALYLRDSYDNAAWLPSEEEGFLTTVIRLQESLAPHASTSNLLLMHGTDHMAPRPDLPGLIKAANARLDDAAIIHATLPMYLEAVRGTPTEQWPVVNLNEEEVSDGEGLEQFPGEGVVVMSGGRKQVVTLKFET